MKHIFLMGDSIRLGYDGFVREFLGDKAQVYWNNDNGRFVQYTLRGITMWADQDCPAEKIDLIHWNNGLWDVIHQFGDEPLVSLEDYQKYLRRIIARLKIVFPHAKICFGLTTQVVEECFTNPALTRNNADIEAYNAAAREIMAEYDIPVDDLYTVSAEMPREWHSTDGTHFTPEGYKALGRAVADFLEKQM